MRGLLTAQHFSSRTMLCYPPLTSAGVQPLPDKPNRSKRALRRWLIWRMSVYLYVNVNGVNSRR